MRRVNTSGKIVITEYKNGLCWVLFDEKGPVEMFFYNPKNINLYDIYVGRVSSVNKSLEACFIDVEKDIKGYLPFNEINYDLCLRSSSEGLKEGDLVIVQVIKEPIKTKLMTLSMNLSIPGTYCVSVCDDRKVHVSSKIGNSESFLLKQYVEENISFEKTGLIIRTNASFDRKEELVSEAKNLKDKLENIIEYGKTRALYSKIYSAKPLFIERTEAINFSLYDEIVTDCTDVYSMFSELSFLKDKIRFYYDKSMSLKIIYNIEKAAKLALEKTVDLPSGGNLFIEPTEALTVIDVNSGKADKKKNKDELINKINAEAVVEAARQLRLRNLYGIIIIDLINMTDSKMEEALINILKKELSKDTLSATFVDITKLGLLELTRQKKYESVYESFEKIN